MEIAKHTDSIILPNFIVRAHGPYHKLYLEKYIDFRDSKGGDDIKENLQRFTSLLEGYIRKHPDQWLWLHKRWKSTPVRTVLVLDDGRAGHLNQSLAVAGEIRKARMAEGYGADDTKIVTVDVEYKSALSRACLAAASRFSSWRCHGCMACMKACLDRKSYDALMRTYSDFVISCGSSLAPVNAYMSYENNAKNIVIMDPGFFPGLGRFHLAIIPKHDRPRKAKNVLRTTIAPNLTDEGAMAFAGERLKNRFNISGNNTVGLFVGGDTSHFCMTAPSIRRILDGVLGFCRRNGAELLVTTSRRTPSAVERVIKEALKDEPVCKMLVIASESNPGGTVNGILHLSSLVVVSAESISMVSEAISSGKRTIVFTLEKKRRGATKHERALAMLEREGHLSVGRPEDLPGLMEKARGNRSGRGELRDKQRIYDAVRRLI
jgi:mitochondrial fission protein ELM1